MHHGAPIDGESTPGSPLARLLLLASRWFDTQLLDELQRRGWPRLTPAQSLVFAHIEREGIPPSELARRLGNTRQTTHELVEGLCRLGLLDIEDNPNRRGGRLVMLTERGGQLAVAGYEILLDLERSFGARRVKSLRGLLAQFDPLPGGIRPAPSARGRGPRAPAQSDIGPAT